jgi:cytochrome oxidase Cu insertion factor (SCO1/SenC/PrrC family)
MFQAVDDFEARFVEKDENGDFVDIRIDPETGEKANVQTYLANRAEAIRKLTGLGAKQQEQAKKSQKKRTTTLPTRKPVKKSDPMMDAFDEEADR